MTSVHLAAFVLGMILGGAMIAVSCIVYAKNQSFGVGGSVLTALGTILVGLSIFSSVEFSLSPKGEFKFQTQIYNAAKDAAKDAIKEVVVADASPTQSGPLPVPAPKPASLPKAGSALHKPPTPASTSAISLAAPDTIERLKLEEQIQRLLDSKEYLEAMKLDPNNVLPIMYYIEQSVQRGKYNEAIVNFPALSRTNKSGVGYSAYPDVALAFERLGKTREAIDVLTELQNTIAQDIALGYGYLSRSQQLEWLDKSLAKADSLASDAEVKQQIANLRNNIKKTITTLRG